MSQAVKKKSLPKLEEENDSCLRIEDGFVWVEIENSPCEVISHENHLQSGNEAEGYVNKYIAQHETNTESSANTEGCPLECNAEIEYGIPTPSEWERGLSVEQQFWEQGYVAKNANGSQPKYPASQRRTIKEYSKIDHSKRRNTDPSHFKFDFPTTVVLKTLAKQLHAGPYHNVIGKGSNSVVIYAEHPWVPWTRHNFRRFYCHYGVAVKVYKLSNDVDKNNAIFKRVQREYAHMQLVYYHGVVPNVVHRMKNVIITQFIGEDQETAPSISSVPPVYCRDLYQLIVNNISRCFNLNLVHGKLCTKSILVRPFNDRVEGFRYYPFFIGWSHSVKTNHPQALVKLMRDCQFVTNFFKSRDVPVKSAEELFKDITGLNEISNRVLNAMYKNDLWQEQLLTNPNRESEKAKSKKKH